MKEQNFYHFSAENGASGAQSLGNALELRKTGGFVWLSYNEPDREDLEALVDAFGIHPLSIDDCFDEEHLPKLDIFPGYTGILFNDFLNGDEGVSIDEINLFLGKNFIVSVFRDGGSKNYRCGDIIEALTLDEDEPVPGPARVLHAILDRIINNKFLAIERIGDKIADFEDVILTEGGRVDNAALHNIRRDLVVIRKSLFHEREILARICRRDSPLIRDADLAYFSNLYDHVAKFVEIVESNRETVTSLVQIQLSLTSNAMAESSNRTNRSVSRLTLITTIFMPLGLLAGIGGMSEWTMMTGPENWKITYPLLLGIMALLGIGNFFLLKWLEKKQAKDTKE